MIDADIPRTFPELNPLFEQVHSLSDSLREILIAFSQLRPDVGYSQGMAHVVGMLLMHCGQPEVGFKMLGNLVMTYDTIYHFYTINLLFIKQYYKVFWKLLKDVCPQLFAELTQPDEIISCNVFVFGWVMSLFSQSLQIALGAFVWDQIFLFGEHQIMRVALAICHAVYGKVKQAPDWQRVIRDCGVHLTKVEHLQPSIKIINRRVSIEQVKTLLKQASTFPTKNLDAEWDFQ